MRARLISLLLAALLLGGCAVHFVPEGKTLGQAAETSAAFVMPDGTRLHYRVWSPSGPPKAVVLALHGMNDSRDAWELPAEGFTAAGIEVISPDQRGFGATAQRGYWPGTRTLVDDARRMALLVRASHPGIPMILMGESMGGAVLMCLATSPNPPPVQGYILIAPAVWGRSEMNIFERVGLWAMGNLLPGLSSSGSFIHVKASDNHEALVRLSNDPLTLHETRFDAVKGLVDLMDAALAAAPRFQARALFLYGGKDELVPKHAMRAAWRELPPQEHVAYYPGAYHLMMRDLGRTVPISDVVSWIFHPGAGLPSGADRAGMAWLADGS